MNPSKIKKDIDLKIRLIHLLVRDVYATLERMDTKTVDSLELYEYEPRTNLGACTRYEFFKSANLMDCLRRYFNDEEWAHWEVFRDEERGDNGR